MAQPRPWVTEIVDTLHDLGGEADLEQIDRRIHLRAKMNFASNRNWKARVRGTIEIHSSDSEAYVQRNSDLFQSVFGIREGRWRLRDLA